VFDLVARQEGYAASPTIIRILLRQINTIKINRHKNEGPYSCKWFVKKPIDLSCLLEKPLLPGCSKMPRCQAPEVLRSVAL
jgi:hypothetical protein